MSEEEERSGARTNTPMCVANTPPWCYRESPPSSRFVCSGPMKDDVNAKDAMDCLLRAELRASAARHRGRLPSKS